MPSTLSAAAEILAAIACAESDDDVQSCLDLASAHWSADGLHRDDILDAAQYLAEARNLRLAGDIPRAMRRETSLNVILSAYNY